MFRKGTGQYQDLTAAKVGNQAAGGGELGDGDEGLAALEKIAKRMFSPRGGSHGLRHKISCAKTQDLPGAAGAQPPAN
jgi:hypothetical protein